MQYVEVEFCPGPSLNLVIGPNGSGKSAIVNGIALALGAKTSVLGRADSIAEFVRFGADVARTEIELYNAEVGQKNFVINRTWGRDGKSTWQFNGKKSKEKDIKNHVAALNIQTDNLCQFLPQDKVHDFSRLNSKDLLAKTVAAFGEPELKTDHDSLKYMAEDIVKKEDEYQSKQSMANEKRKRYEELELVVKTFEDKENLKEKIKIFEQRKEWALTAELKEQLEIRQRKQQKRAERAKAAENQAKEHYKIVQQAQNERVDIEMKMRTDIQKSLDLNSKARAKSNKVKNIGDALENVSENFRRRQLQEKEKEKDLKSIEVEIESLKQELAGTNDTDDLEARSKVVERENQDLHTERERYKQEIGQNNRERLALEVETTRLKETRKKLLNVDFNKREVLRKTLYQGKDICTAIEWIENNKNKFVGQVYMPMALLINVTNPDNAKHVESVIPLRDLIAFGVDNPADAKVLINELRTKLKLQINVIVYNQDLNLNKYKPSVDPTRIPANFDFTGYINEMFTAPVPVIAYLCEVHHIHQAPVFGRGAQPQVKRLIDEFHFRTFLIDQWIHNVAFSLYSGKSLTSSRRFETRQLLSISVDKAEIQEVENKIENLQQKMAVILDQLKTLNSSMKTIDRNLERVLTELKELNQRKNHKKQLRVKLSAKENQREALAKQLNPEEVEKAKRKMKSDQKRHLVETIKLIREIKDTMVESNRLKISSKLCKIKQDQNSEAFEELKRKEDDFVNKLSDLKISLGEANENLRRAKLDYNEQLEIALKLSKIKSRSDTPPPNLVKLFEKEGIAEIPSYEASIRINELKGQFECLDDVDQHVFNEFKELQETINRLEAENSDLERNVTAKRDEINVVKERWLTRMGTLMTQVDDKFREFFAAMGYAGQVNLSRGNSEDDFANYGVEILVKFRENMPLQKLDPFRQSGGERSVSTALYMMALQSLTKVPFRCVDEINQGMDEYNERKVFEMLMQTSVQDQTAQYFLLTPKLLQNLNYQEGVTVLIVHHGDHMCSHTEWDMDQFVEAARASE